MAFGLGPFELLPILLLAALAAGGVYLVVRSASRRPVPGPGREERLTGLEQRLEEVEGGLQEVAEGQRFTTALLLDRAARQEQEPPRP